jgi:hypothetical protein
MRSEIYSEQWMQQFQQQVNRDQQLSQIGTFFNCTFVWKIGEIAYLFLIEKGKVLDIRVPMSNDSWDFTIEGPKDTWLKFAESSPSLEYYDLLGILTKHEDSYLIGNRLKAMQHMRSLRRLFQIVKEVHL